MRNDFQRSLVLASARASRVSLADAQTPSTPLRQTSHARRRAAQRNLGDTAVEYIMTWGRVIHRTGAQFYFLGRKDIPAQHQRTPWVMRLVGAVVLVSSDGSVITLYRNISALRDILRKMKYRITPGEEPICADAETWAEADTLAELRGA